jgi:hypothetical protein
VPARPGVKLEKGSPANKADVERCFSEKTPDVVFITLASSKTTSNDGFLTHVLINLAEVMEKYGTRKVIYMSAFGVGDSHKSLNFVMKFVVSHTKLETEFKDHEGAEQVLRQLGEKGVQWTAVRPVMLKNGPAKEVEFLGNQGEKVEKFMSGVTRASVAQFMVQVAEDEEWNGKTPVISNP